MLRMCHVLEYDQDDPGAKRLRSTPPGADEARESSRADPHGLHRRSPRTRGGQAFRFRGFLQGQVQNTCRSRSSCSRADQRGTCCAGVSLRFVVADASALVEYLLLTANARRVALVLESNDVDVWVPALCDVELVAGVRRSLLRGLLSKSRAAQAIEDYLDLPLVRSGHQPLLARMFELRSNFTSYDATYVSLADKLRAKLLTTDERLARAVRAHTKIPVLLD